MALLEIEGLTVEFGGFRAVDGVSYTIEEGEILGIVGESGSGKSVSQHALMGLVGFPGVVSAERMNFAGNDMLALTERQQRAIRGKDIAMVFQEPMTSLNPCFTIGFQVGEALKVHEKLGRKARQARTIELLGQVGIPSPAERLSAYPHQMSGGMNQRVMIAMAIACRPKLLIADEPTTALDVTIQAQVLDLLVHLQRDSGMALVLITHDMAVVAETAHRAAVMYAGQIVEENAVEVLFSAPRHPYTAALLDALPERGIGKDRLPTIPGVVPGFYDRPVGCLFAPRCAFADGSCVAPADLRKSAGGRLRCHHPLPDKSAA